MIVNASEEGVTSAIKFTIIMDEPIVMSALRKDVIEAAGIYEITIEGIFRDIMDAVFSDPSRLETDYEFKVSTYNTISQMAEEKSEDELNLMPFNVILLPLFLSKIRRQLIDHISGYIDLLQNKIKERNYLVSKFVVCYLDNVSPPVITINLTCSLKERSPDET